MEPSFGSYLTAVGVNDSVISVPEDELVVTSMISLRVSFLKISHGKSRPTCIASEGAGELHLSNYLHHPSLL